MSRDIIAHPTPTRNSPSSAPGTDLICPVCRGQIAYNSRTRRVRCVAGDWAQTLTAGQNADLLNAVLGISPMDCAAFLLVLATAAGSIVREAVA